MTLIVENEGILDLKVNITSDTSINDILAPFEIPGHTTKKVRFLLSFFKKNYSIIISFLTFDYCRLILYYLETRQQNLF